MFPLSEVYLVIFSQGKLLQKIFAGCFIIAVLCGFSRSGLPWIDKLESYSLDQRFHLRGPREPLKDIVIVGINSESIAFEDRPFATWNPVHAELIQALITASASSVFFDLNYDSRFDRITRQMVASHCVQNGIELPSRVINTLGFDTPLIRAFLDARKAGLKVILGFFYYPRFTSSLYKMFVVPWLAFTNLTLDNDQMTRSLPVFAMSGPSEHPSGFPTGVPSGIPTIFPSVSLAIAAEMTHQGFSVASDGSLLLGSSTVDHLNEAHEGLIDYAGPQNTYLMEPYKNILLDARTAPERLRRLAGKTILVGLWQVDDNKNAPFGKIPGIEVHANAIENIIHNRFLQRYGESFTLVLMLVFMILQLLGFAWGTGRGGILSLAFLAGWVITVHVLFRQSLVLPFARPALFLLAFGIFQTFHSYYFLQTESRKVRNLFRRYVNDSVIKDILQDSGNSLTKGRRGDICVMFIDIRGFTSFSEGRDPGEVVGFLNRYFEGLTDIILRHHGVVDKFLGDGLMAFFNAPIPRPTFVSDAVETALEIREFIAQFPIREEEGSFQLKIGLAIHVGEALVGNVGSERKMEFTAIGDTVNTTSRLEALNKEFGTDIIGSQTVVSATSETYNWRELGEHTIRGKEITVRLYALDGRKPSPEGNEA